jgi:hypothetical protein
LLLGLLEVTGVWGSSVYIWVFVEVVEVAGIPNSKEGDGDDDKHASHLDRGSGSVSLRGVEHNEEAASNDHWDQKDKSNKDVPPVIVLVKEAIEDLNEEDKEKDEGDNTNGNDTTLNWETTAAREVSSLLGLALAYAAAAEFVILEL